MTVGIANALAQSAAIAVSRIETRCSAMGCVRFAAPNRR